MCNVYAKPAVFSGRLFNCRWPCDSRKLSHVHAQFLYAERTANPALEKEPAASPEKMSIHFGCAEVIILGSGLKRLEGWLQGYELSFVMSADNYSGTRIYYGDYLTGDAEHARSLLARYRPDTKMVVFYDPDKPDRAVLETGVHGGVWLGLGIGTLFLVVAAFGLSKGRTKAGICSAASTA